MKKFNDNMVLGEKKLVIYLTEEKSPYLFEKDISLFLKDEKEFDLFLNFFENESADKDLLIIEEDKKYYHANIVLWYLKEHNLNKEAESLYLFLKENKLDKSVWNFIETLLNGEKAEFIEDFKKYDDVLTTLEKEKDFTEEDYSPVTSMTFFGNLDKIIADLKDNYNFDEDFGKYEEGFNSNTIEAAFYEISDFDINVETNIGELIYIFLKNKPFISENEEILCALIVDYLRQGNIISKKDVPLLSSSDLIRIIDISKEYLDEGKEKIIEKIRPLFQYFHKTSQKKLDLELSKVKADPTIENVLCYIMNFVENYKGYSGYYDYYQGKMPEESDEMFAEFSSRPIYKLHYHGDFYSFKLDLGKSLADNNTLHFNVSSIAYIEAPINLDNRGNFIEQQYEEIVDICTKNCIKELKKELSKQLKEITYFENIKLKFNFNWTLEIEENYSD